MKRAALAVLLVLGLATAGFAYQQFQREAGVFFTDQGGNNAQAAIVYTRDSSDVQTLEFQTTTSDTVQFFLNATTLEATAGNTFSLEGATADASETTITVTDPTADRTVTLPDSTFTAGTRSVTCRMQLLLDMIDQSCFIADRVYTVTRIDYIATVAESLVEKRLGSLHPEDEGKVASVLETLIDAKFIGRGYSP